MPHENITNEDLEKICRICLQQSEHRIDLFSSTPQFSLVSNAIMECAPIQILFGDNLPHSICQDCIVQLDVAYRFRVLCIKSDITLRQRISQNNKKVKNESGELKENNECTININENDSNGKIKEEISTIDSDDDDVKPTEDDSSETSRKLPVVKKLYTCIKCSTKFIRKDRFQKHENRCLKRKTVLVTDETRVATNDNDNDIKQLNKIKPYATFKDNVILNENGRYACGICMKTYKSKYHTAIHAIIHSDIRYRCPHCDKGFVRLNTLSKHINIHTGKRSYNCEFCGKTFRTDSALNTHRRIHLGIRPYKCHICERSFTQNKTLKNHIRTHTGERPFVCETCGRSFNRKHVLKTHTMTHEHERTTNNISKHVSNNATTSKRTYHCEFCGKIFQTDSGLNTHRRIHLGVRPYKCDVCERSFTQNKTLKNHMRTHTGERPFVCKTCGRSFNRKHILTTHTMIHTGERPYKCDFCTRTFICRRHLKFHLKKHSAEPITKLRCNMKNTNDTKHTINILKEKDMT